MNTVTTLLLGILIGWIVAWLIDRFFWRQTEEEAMAVAECQAKLASAQAEITGLNASLEAARVDSEKLIAARGEISQLRAQVEEAKVQHQRLQAAEARVAELEAELAAVEEEVNRLQAALAAMSANEAVEPDDLTKIEGIGPKINGILQTAGIQTFAQLAEATGERLQEILEAAGDRYRLAEPDTWPEQAALAAREAWDELAKLQEELSGGRREARRRGP